MTETVTVKSIDGALEFWCEDSAPYSAVYDALYAKLTANADFYRGAAGRVVFYGKHFSEIHKRELRAVLRSELGPAEVLFSDEEPQEPEPPEASAEPEPPQEPEVLPPQSLFLTQTLRSGQLVRAEGDVTVIGDVNAGAEIIAGGNIAVFGSLRGVVHAGAFGRPDVTIAAGRLLASQIRICGKIAVLPKRRRASLPELVRLSEDGKVTITTMN